ncbi:MAG: hypothetical protein ACFE0J_25735 [Elainellaceae cyanobacterium]
MDSSHSNIGQTRRFISESSNDFDRRDDPRRSPPSFTPNTMLKPLLAQFQARYPMGGLISEFVAIHGEQYVVRALVQIGGVSLASGLAAASDIELAEDRAKARALEALGISPSPMSQLPNMSLDSSALQSRPLIENSMRGGSSNPSSIPPTQVSSGSNSDAFTAAKTTPFYQFGRSSVERSPIEPDISDTSDTSPPISSSASQAVDPPQPEQQSAPIPPIPDGAEAESTAPKANKKSKRKAVSNEADVSSTVQQDSSTDVIKRIDLSDAIAKTSVELKRLGWNEVQGRQHLQKAYGKRSRQQLSDTELLDFLEFLEAQPSPSEPSQIE